MQTFLSIICFTGTTRVRDSEDTQEAQSKPLFSSMIPQSLISQKWKRRIWISQV